MSADSSVVRGAARAPATSAALRVAAELALSTVESYAAGSEAAPVTSGDGRIMWGCWVDSSGPTIAVRPGSSVEARNRVRTASGPCLLPGRPRPRCQLAGRTCAGYEAGRWFRYPRPVARQRRGITV